VPERKRERVCGGRWGGEVAELNFWPSDVAGNVGGFRLSEETALERRGLGRNV